MKIERFEDIISWQKSKELSLFIYRLLKNNHDRSFKDQIQRATISVGNNIAEGFERKSNRELKNFLYIAKGSAEKFVQWRILRETCNISSRKTSRKYMR